MTDESSINVAPEYKQPWPKDQAEFLIEIQKIFDSRKIKTMKDYEAATDAEREEGYQLSADTLWKVAIAAFNYAAGVVGASGFQASYGALRFYGESMGIKGPFAIIKAEDQLYPQTSVMKKVFEYLDSWLPWVREEAQKKLDDYNSTPEDKRYVHPNVYNHWLFLTEDHSFKYGTMVKPSGFIYNDPKTDKLSSNN